MRHARLQFAAMSFFILAFVLAGSGWSLVFAANSQGRADWSVCGQDMCSCLPTTKIEPFCPLCLIDDTDESSCSNSDPEPTDAPKRLPKSDRFEAASSASQAGCASIFLSFVFGARQIEASVARVPSAHLIAQDDAPTDPHSDLATPPPRA